MANKLLELLVGHFDFISTSAIYEAHDLASFLKNEETIGIDLNSLGYLFEGCRLVAFIGISFDLKASLGVGRFRVSEFVHAPTLFGMHQVAKLPFALLAELRRYGLF